MLRLLPFVVLFISLNVNARYGDNFNVDEMRFAQACDASIDQLTIAGVGDLLMHGPLQKTAAEHQSFSILWNHVLPVLSQADVMYANLETPLAGGLARRSSRPGQVDPKVEFDDRVYTGFPLFNTHPQLAADLVSSGFDVVSTANNHALDRGSRGVDLTIEALRHAGLLYTGTRPSDEPEAPWFTYVERGGWRVAFLACTFSTNGNPDKYDQTLNCFNDTELLLKIVGTLAQLDSVDAVIVTPHWGSAEYVHTPDGRNVALGHQLIEAGATAVIGTHPHVLQPWEKYRAADGREGLIAYSTGNFVSNQSQWPRRMGLSVFLGLSRDGQGRVWINGVRYHPLYMNRKPYQLESLPEGKDFARQWGLLADLLGTDRYLANGEELVTNRECFENQPFTPLMN